MDLPFIFVLTTSIMKEEEKMSDKKYELILHDCKTFTDSNGVQFNLYRIRALKDFTTIDGVEVCAGDCGGRVGGEYNLSQNGNCWITSKCSVYDNAKICDDCLVAGHAFVSGNALLKGKVHIDEDSSVTDNAVLTGNINVKGDVCIYDNAYLNGNINIEGKCRISDNAHLDGNINIEGKCIIWGDCDLSGNITIESECYICDDVSVKGFDSGVKLVGCRLEENCSVTDCAQVKNCLISGFAIVQDHAQIHGENPCLNKHHKGHVVIDGHSKIMEHAEILDEAHITGNACVGGHYKCFNENFINGNMVLR